MPPTPRVNDCHPKHGNISHSSVSDAVSAPWISAYNARHCLTIEGLTVRVGKSIQMQRNADFAMPHSVMEILQRLAVQWHLDKFANRGNVFRRGIMHALR